MDCIENHIDIEKVQDEIIERLKPLDPEKIILFGSYAWGKPSKDSDIDLYIVTKDNFIPENYSAKREIVRKVSSQIHDIRTRFSIDLIVHTSKMSEKFFGLNSSLAREISKKGKLLYGKRIG